jgi:hypothetical protein
MIRASLKVRSTRTRFTVEVQAESITQAVSLATACYLGCGVNVLFPIDSEAFFADGDSSTSQVIPLGAEKHRTLREPLRRNGPVAV